MGSAASFVERHTTEDGVTVLRMNRPEKLNGWTEPMLLSLFDSFMWASEDESTTSVVLTGTGKYYCAGVDLGGSFKPMSPQSMYDHIRVSNQRVFDTFIDFPKPLVVAVNGPAIGASVTSATLCDAVIASDRATFLTPFGRLGVTPEGCSSVHFERLMGRENAKRMLEDDWTPSADEALDIGLIDEVCAHDDLLARAIAVASSLAKDGSARRLDREGLLETYREVNRRESAQLAEAFLSEKFLRAQHDFLSRKGKHGPARLFSFLAATRPLWSLAVSFEK